MANDNSLSILKQAFNAGFEAFSIVNPIEGKPGCYAHPDNPYTKDSLPWKEWQRGWNRAYWEQQKANKRAAI